MSVVFIILQRDLLLAWRRAAQVLQPLAFFIVVTLLFPLGYTPELAQLRQIAPGVLWVAALLAAILPLDRLVEPDDAMRREVVSIAKRVVNRGRGVFVLVNNKAEGSSPLTVTALARQLADTDLS